MKKRTLNRKRFELKGVILPDVSKGFEEVEIKFSEYTLGIVNHLVTSELALSLDLAMKINNSIAVYLKAHLQCNRCKSIFEDIEFYAQKSQYANRCRATICKQCWKQEYGRVIW